MKLNYDIIQYSTYVISVIVGLSGFIIYKLQNKIIYAANCPIDSRKVTYTPKDFEMDDYEDLEIETKDGIKIRAFLIKKFLDIEKTKLAKSMLVYFHANAGNMGHRLPIVKSFVEECGCNVLIISYRGYGFSEGQATEEGIKIDAQSTLEYILQRPDLKDLKLVFFGQSIGGAVATYLAAENQERVQGVILENTFLTMRKLIPNLLPWLGPFTFLCHEKWESEKELLKFTYKKKINGTEKFIPVLMLNSELDEIVPNKQFEEFCKILRNTRREASTQKEREIEENGNTEPDTPDQILPREQYNVYWHRFDGVHHNDTCIHPEYYPCIKSWWRKNIDEN